MDFVLAHHHRGGAETLDDGADEGTDLRRGEQDRHFILAAGLVKGLPHLLDETAGRQNLIEREKKTLARARSVRSHCVRPVFVHGDHVVVRWIFEFEWLDGRRTRMEELAYQRWEGERIAEEQFFYDPAQLD